MFDHKAMNKHIFRHDPQQLISICFLTVALFPHRFGEENFVILSLLFHLPNYFDWMSSFEVHNSYIQGLRCPVLIYDVRRLVFSFRLCI